MKKSIRFAAVAAAFALAAGAAAFSPAQAATTKTFNVWWYESNNPSTPMDATWTAALTEFKKLHPDVKVNFQRKTWDQIQKAGISILQSNAAPDLSEWNKGNATAGLAAKGKLLTDLTPYMKKYGWNKQLGSSVLLYGQYTPAGLMGSGKQYGISVYGEYVSVFYNKDIFAKNGIAVPTTNAELEAAMAKLKAAGVQPMVLGGKDYMNVHMLYSLALQDADQAWVKSFQLFQGTPVSFDVNSKQWGRAAKQAVAWNKAGYFGENVAGTTPDDAVQAFEQGKAAMLIGGSWLDAGINDVITKAGAFKYGKFLVPGLVKGKGLTVGSAGNLWVIPTKSKQKDLAAEFINLTLTKKYQNYLANKGGLALLADAAAVKNPAAAITVPPFTQAVKANALGMYPDWPVNGYYEIMRAAGQKLLADGDAAAYVKAIGDFYEQGKP